ncbi:aryl-alcohol dehydrogenase [Dacryopinax primogenitus]|uniref:Aryl-alcohol dehydrogenase n=1 Tax=Dacryopinax primogenitus (strain DJM 731) TaxID=1858805 RepID=M5GC10_DACPD|nr:aryl-alcohol dehydrogenase [Dacryopinax primogenitus]EJU06549.1 aryl-alcohol dehydrogenase [Dacryopinax primogenitus]
MALFQPTPKPATPLGEWRLLSPNAGVRVSPLCLGAMSLGDKWGRFMAGTMTKDEVFKLCDTFFEAGGNFIDTANNYQDEQSEALLGEWMKARGNRDQIVLATKFTTCYVRGREDIKYYQNYGGNHAKSLHTSVRDSLAKLQTDYIDLLWVHWWDYSTSIPELMQSLDALVKAGKVLYLGISDTPAWIVAKANQYARDHGMAQFIAYQGQWSCLERDFEGDILPMCSAEGMAVAPWGVVGGGKFKTAAQIEARKKESGGHLRTFAVDQTPEQKAISAALEQVAKEIGGDASLANVAIAYCLHKQAYVFPIIGGRKPEYLLENIKALSIKLTPEQMDFIDNAVPFKLPFPHNMLGTDPRLTRTGTWNGMFMASGGGIKFPKAPAPVPPTNGDSVGAPGMESLLSGQK